jgi:hypothetical protein
MFLVYGSVDPTTVKDSPGHKDIKVTLRYAHFAPVHMSRAVEILDSTLETSYTKAIQFRG